MAIIRKGIPCNDGSKIATCSRHPVFLIEDRHTPANAADADTISAVKSAARLISSFLAHPADIYLLNSSVP